MNFNENQTVRIAILDLYEGTENQGMRGMREIINQFGELHHLNIISQEFNVRLKNELPDTNWDIYISSGGPGSPIDTEGQEWDIKFGEWLDKIDQYNSNPNNIDKKHIYLICHSFQLACRHYDIGLLSKRKSTSFGVFPVHLLEDGLNEPIFEGMADPFYAVDSRDYQITEPNYDVINKMGAKILCLEKERPYVPYERAIMGIRFSEYCIGTQFHPEADAIGMTLYLQKSDKKEVVIENHGLEKWESMIEQLDDPDKIVWTYSHILPNFLGIAINSLHQVSAA